MSSHYEYSKGTRGVVPGPIRRDEVKQPARVLYFIISMLTSPAPPNPTKQIHLTENRGDLTEHYKRQASVKSKLSFSSSSSFSWTGIFRTNESQTRVRFYSSAFTLLLNRIKVQKRLRFGSSLLLRLARRKPDIHRRSYAIKHLKIIRFRHHPPLQSSIAKQRQPLILNQDQHPFPLRLHRRSIPRPLLQLQRQISKHLHCRRWYILCQIDHDPVVDVL